MAKRKYLYELCETEMFRKMEHEFEASYPFTKATFVINKPLYSQMVMRIFDRKQHYIATFVGTDFDCYNANEAKLEKNKSEIKLDNKDVKRWYVRWMKVHFNTYKDDYIANINKIANDDLGV